MTLVPQPAPDVKQQADRTDEPGLDDRDSDGRVALGGRLSAERSDGKHGDVNVAGVEHDVQHGLVRSGLNCVELHDLDPQ